MTSNKLTMSPENFADLGGGSIAYVRPMSSDEIKSLFPNTPPLESGLDLWALLGADGTPIMLADSRDAVVMNAHENDLETVSLH